MHLLQKPFYFGYGRGTTVEEKAIQVTGSGTSQQGFVLHSSPQAADYQLQRPKPLQYHVHWCFKVTLTEKFHPFRLEEKVSSSLAWKNDFSEYGSANNGLFFFIGCFTTTGWTLNVSA